MDLLLIRHANNPAPGPAEIDPDLSQTGVDQAHHLGARLQSEGHSNESLARQLGRLESGLVLTAHPAEVARRTLIQ
jgi:phosphoenolpyruvate carboxylase